MRTERQIQTEIIFKLLAVVVCALLYAWGGMEMKWLRRFLAPAICGGALWYFTRDPWALVVAPLLGLASSLGYGAEALGAKIWKRAYVGAAFTIAANAYRLKKAVEDAARDKCWQIGYCDIHEVVRSDLWRPFLITLGGVGVIIVGSFVIFGVFNTLPDARHEESFLGALIYTCVLLTARRKEES